MSKTAGTYKFIELNSNNYSAKNT